MYCSINRLAYFRERTAAFATTSFNKGGGRILEGGFIFGDYGITCVQEDTQKIS